MNAKVNQVPQNLQAIQTRIVAACERAKRPPSEVRLLVVSKTWPVEAIAPVVEAGQIAFGESRLQEAEKKIPLLPANLEWHFIGTLQRNKVRKILPLFPVIHSISSFKLAEYSDRIAGELALRPTVYLSLNLAEEESKTGMKEEELRENFRAIADLKNLKIAGLMCLPPFSADPENSRPWFRRLRELRDEMTAQHGVSLPGLSMGMSGDFEIAIEEGATIVRVGSAIFGER